MSDLLLYHYTRTFKSSILNNGLLARDERHWRNVFLEKYIDMMPKFLFSYFESTWNLEYEDSIANPQARLWFVSSRPTENDACIRPLISMYGGESISMCADEDSYSEEFLESIGEPMEVVCSIPIDDPFIAILGNGEVFLERDVLASEIKEVNNLAVNKHEWKFIK